MFDSDIGRTWNIYTHLPVFIFQQLPTKWRKFGTLLTLILMGLFFWTCDSKQIFNIMNKYTFTWNSRISQVCSGTSYPLQAAQGPCAVVTMARATLLVAQDLHAHIWVVLQSPLWESIHVYYKHGGQSLATCSETNKKMGKRNGWVVERNWRFRLCGSHGIHECLWESG